MDIIDIWNEIFDMGYDESDDIPFDVFESACEKCYTVPSDELADKLYDLYGITIID